MTAYERAHEALVRLWTRAVGTPGYDKADWKALDNAIDELRILATGKDVNRG